MMTVPFSVGKLMLFASSNILGGLLQVWVLYAALAVLGKEHSLAVLLGDGGLFFFSTSLTVSSILILYAENSGKRSSIDMTFTLVAILVSLVMSVVVYIVVLTNRPGVAEPFHDHPYPQISCAAVAFAYSFFVAARTGYFSR